MIEPVRPTMMQNASSVDYYGNLMGCPTHQQHLQQPHLNGRRVLVLPPNPCSKTTSTAATTPTACTADTLVAGAAHSTAPSKSAQHSSTAPPAGLFELQSFIAALLVTCISTGSSPGPGSSGSSSGSSSAHLVGQAQQQVQQALVSEVVQALQAGTTWRATVGMPARMAGHMAQALAGAGAGPAAGEWGIIHIRQHVVCQTYMYCVCA